MAKEQTQQMKLLNKNCELLLKRCAKAYHLKKKLDCLWTERDGMICVLAMFVSMGKEQPELHVRALVKPIWLDHLLWDIMDMPQHKTEPLSTHVVGAFTLLGAPMTEEQIPVNGFSVPVLEHLMTEKTEEFADSLPAYTEEAYFEKLDAGIQMEQGDMMRVLNAIHRGDAKRARALLARKSLASYSRETEDFRKQALKWLDKPEHSA